MDLANSSIFDSVDGFGGDGDHAGQEIVGGGRCVVDGPFAELQPILYNHTYIRHCIARGFRDGEEAGRISGEYYRPESIGSILRKQSYVQFVREVEIYLHNPLHQGINGDFLAMTAANGIFPFCLSPLYVYDMLLIDVLTDQILFSTSIMHSWIIYGGGGSRRIRR